MEASSFAMGNRYHYIALSGAGLWKLAFLFDGGGGYAEVTWAKVLLAFPFGPAFLLGMNSEGIR